MPGTEITGAIVLPCSYTHRSICTNFIPSNPIKSETTPLVDYAFRMLDQVHTSPSSVTGSHRQEMIYTKSTVEPKRTMSPMNNHLRIYHQSESRTVRPTSTPSSHRVNERIAWMYSNEIPGSFNPFPILDNPLPYPLSQPNVSYALGSIPLLPPVS